MTMTLSAQRSQYTNDAILSASPVRLLTMLYDRLLLDLDRASLAQAEQNWSLASSHLLHAQAIVAELTSSLKVELWDGGEGLLALYNYCRNLLVLANVRRDGASIRESIDLLSPLRDAWHEAASQLSVPEKPSRSESRELGVA